MFKKSLLAAAIVSTFCSAAALAITSEGELETRQALEEKGLPTGGNTADIEKVIFSQLENDPTPIFGVVSTIDSTIATTISSLGGEPPAPPTTPDIEGALTELSEGNPEGAIAILTGDEETVPPSTGPGANAGAIAVTVSGNVQANLSCDIVNGDSDFDFGDIDLNTGGTIESGAVGFTISCNNETTATNIYLTTNDQDPATPGAGSNALVAEFSDGVATSDVNLAVLAGTAGSGVAIGSGTADFTSAGDKTATAISLYATLDTTQITSGSGGSLTEKGAPEIAVWVN